MEHYSNLVSGGQNIYGFSIGILMLETKFPRIPGEIGNALTWDFPVLYKVVSGASVAKVVTESDSTLLKPFIDCANELIDAGVSAITTSCGFLAMFQKEMAASVSVPIFTSSLIMAPLIYSMLKPEQKVGIMTFSADSLGDKHFKGVGIENIPKVVFGMPKESHFCRAIREEDNFFDTEKVEKEHVEVAVNMVQKHPDIGAILLECTNMPPYAKAIRKATNLPIFDIVSFTKFIHDAVTREYKF
ncbi:MAG: aspartate/glutamate racemase family protein [Eubacteriales bacterium]|nr:aspartate/glutamate racemase family protein [Eubacteriales bacterium]